MHVLVPPFNQQLNSWQRPTPSAYVPTEGPDTDSLMFFSKPGTKTTGAPTNSDICSICRHLNLQSDNPIVRIDSGDLSVKSTTWPAAVLVCSGRSIFTLLEHAVAKAASLSGTARPRTAKQLPDSINFFGWCTWDAFYSTVSAKVLLPLSWFGFGWQQSIVSLLSFASSHLSHSVG